MTKTTDDRLEELKDEVNALRQLVLSHVVASNIIDSDAARITLSIMSSQYDEALKQGRHRVTMYMNTFADDIRRVVANVAND